MSQSLETNVPGAPRDPVLLALERIERRIGRLEERAERLEAPMQQAPGLLAAAVDTMDGTVERLRSRGVDVDERARAVARLVEQLTRPESVRALSSLAELARNAPGLFAAATDTLDETIGRLAERGVNVDERLRTTLDVAERLTSPAALAAVSSLLDHVDQLQYLLDSGVFGQPAVHLVSELGRALAEAGDSPPRRVGLLGAVRAMSDPDVQSALGFALRLASRFGQALRSVSAVAPRSLSQGQSR